MKTLERMQYAIAAKDAAWSCLPILMADFNTGSLVHVSKFAAGLFGYKEEDLVDQKFTAILPEMLTNGIGRVTVGVRKGGERFPCHVGLTTIKVDDRLISVSIIVDLTGIVDSAQVNPSLASIQATVEDTNERVQGLEEHPPAVQPERYPTEGRRD